MTGKHTLRPERARFLPSFARSALLSKAWGAVAVTCRRDPFRGWYAAGSVFVVVFVVVTSVGVVSGRTGNGDYPIMVLPGLPVGDISGVASPGPVYTLTPTPESQGPPASGSRADRERATGRTGDRTPPDTQVALDTATGPARTRAPGGSRASDGRRAEGDRAPAGPRTPDAGRGPGGGRSRGGDGAPEATRSPDRDRAPERTRTPDTPAPPPTRPAEPPARTQEPPPAPTRDAPAPPPPPRTRPPETEKPPSKPKPTPTKTTPRPSGRITARYVVHSSWHDGFTVGIQVTNDTNTTQDWSVKVVHERSDVVRVKELWNASLKQGGATTNVFTGGALAPGASVTFGFKASKGVSHPVRPTDCVVKNGGCRVG